MKVNWLILSFICSFFLVSCSQSPASLQETSSLEPIIPTEITPTITIQDTLPIANDEVGSNSNPPSGGGSKSADAPESGLSPQNIDNLSTITIDASVWKSRDVPLTDVIEQVSYVRPGGAGGGGPCVMDPPDISAGPVILFDLGFMDGSRELSINQDGLLCVFGFNVNEFVTVSIIRPDNEKVIISTKVEGLPFNPQYSILHYEIMPKSGDPIGSYNITFMGEDSSVESTYEVVQAQEPILGIIDSTGDVFSTNGKGWGWFNRPSFIPGDIISLFIAGYQPNSSISFHLYRAVGIELVIDDIICFNGCDKKVFEHASSWESESNDRGELTTNILTDPNIPNGEYFFLITGPNAPICEFSGPYFNKYGDWDDTLCDLPFVIDVGEAILPTVIPSPNVDTCSASLPPHLIIDERAYVSLKPPYPNTMRHKPGKKIAEIGKIPPGQEVKVLEGPVCVDGWYWWKVKDVKTDKVGWTPEGDDENYWLIPK